MRPMKRRTGNDRATALERLLQPFREFFEQEASGGVLLIATTVVALVWANSPWHHAYETLREFPIAVGLGACRLAHPLEWWVNDGLMVLFFVTVGLEIKREILGGELSTARKAALPIVAAAGGMVVPALIYTAFNVGTEAIKGWGVPMATDIAFALGVLALLGSRAPASLKVFLAALAIADDLGAVLVIALFYTDTLRAAGLAAMGIVVALLLRANRLGIRALPVYGLAGLTLWAATLYSGVHPTIAGVLLAFTIPAHTHRDGPSESPLLRMEHLLLPWVTRLILPLFALVNAGLALDSGAARALASPVALGVGLGLLIGKPIGVLGASWLAIRAGFGQMPSGATWRHLLGVSCLAGIGFTMALFVDQLAFGHGPNLEHAKLGILLASLLAGIAGCAVLATCHRTARDA